jgi:hypothetical protein
LHLTINHSTTSDTTVTACNSYVWNAVTYTTSGIKTFTTTNAAGCDSVATLHLTINVPPSAPSIAATDGGVTTFCSGFSAVLASDSANGNQWYRDDVLLNGETGYIYTATTSGNYTVTYTAENGCTSPHSNAIAVTVNPLPTLSGSLTENVFSDSLFSYIPASAITGTSFTWTRAAVSGISNLASSGSGSISESLSDTTGSSVNVTYVYTLNSPAGCTNTQSLVVSVNHLNGGRIGIVKVNPKLPPTQSPPDQVSLDVTAMPNPTTSWFKLVIKSSDKTAVTIKVFDVFGKMVENHQKISPDAVLQLGQGWAAGAYFVEVLQSDKRKVVKIIKTN